MKTSLALVTSRELSSFSFYKDALYAFESVLSKGLLGFNSDLVEEICIRLKCESPVFAQFSQAQRPKYYEDKTFKYRGSVTPEVRLYKCLTADFVVNFEGYFKLTTKEECLTPSYQSRMAYSSPELNLCNHLTTRVTSNVEKPISK